MSQDRPGGHDLLPAKKIDPSAFSLAKTTSRAQPDTFMKKGTGTGGTLVSVASHVTLRGRAAVAREEASMGLRARAPAVCLDRWRRGV